MSGSTGKLSAIVLCGYLAFLALASVLERLGLTDNGLLWIQGLFTLSIVVAVAFAYRTSDATTFLVAGRGIPEVANGIAIATTWIPAGSFVTFAGLLYTYGYDATVFLVGTLSGLVLHGVLVAPYLARSRAVTVAEFLGLRFGGPVRLAAALIIAGISFAILVASLSAWSLLAAKSLQLPNAWCLAGGVALLLLCALSGGMNSLSWTALVLGLGVLVAILGAIVAVSVSRTGMIFPHIGYGEIVDAITGLERTMIENGFADARSLKPHLKPFLQIDVLNSTAMALVILTGTAALPQIASRALTNSSGRGARSSVAWAVLFSFLVVTAAPIYAAFAKLEVYSLISQGTKLSDLPNWMEGLAREGDLRVHGLDVGTVEAVRAAISGGAAEPAAVATYLETHVPQTFRSWSILKPQVQGAVVGVLRALPEGGEATTWDIFRTNVLPAVGTAAGVKSGVLMLGALDIDSGALALALPEIAHAPVIASSLLVIGVLSALLAVAAASLACAACTLGHDILSLRKERVEPGPRSVSAVRLAMFAVAAAAAAAVLGGVGDGMALVLTALGVAASALLPALVLGIWWARTPPSAALAGILVGAAIPITYAIGTQLTPVAFHELWPQASNAAPAALRKFADLKSAWITAEGSAKDAAQAALEAHARGTVLSPGVANWLSLNICAVSMLAIPAAIFVMGVVSLMTRSSHRPEVLEAIRRPG